MTARETLGWWEGRRIRKGSRKDLVAMGVLTFLTLAVVVTGRRASSILSPRAAIEEAEAMNDLEIPAQLPNAHVRDRAGARTPIFDRMKTSRAVVAFYAPWCGPCQKELPLLSRQVGTHGDLFVVVSKDEDTEATARQFANLGLSELDFFVDETGGLEREAHVTALPTTYLVVRQGVVLDRTKGFSWWELRRLTKRVVPEDSLDVPVEEP